MALTKLLCLVCFSLLLLGGVSPETVDHYTKAGDDVTLPCDGLRDEGPTCLDVDWWLYKSSTSHLIDKVTKGVVQDSGSSRLSLNSDCSLSLYDVTEDDSGAFHCGLQSTTYTTVYLNVLTVSPAPVDPNKTSDGDITLQCSLGRYDPHCGSRKFLWLGQNKEELSGETKNCVSYLTVERQSQHNRIFTCQYEERNKGKVSVEYRLWGKIERLDPQDPGGVNRMTNTYYIIAGAVVSLLVLLVVAAVVLFKVKSKRRASRTTPDTPDDPLYHLPADPVVDPESGVTYASINYTTTKSKKQVVVEDTVTYSAVSIKTKPDCSNSAIYSTVNKANGRTNT